MDDRTRMVNYAGITATSLMLWWIILIHPAAYLALMGAAAIAALIGRE